MSKYILLSMIALSTLLVFQNGAALDNPAPTGNSGASIPVLFVNEAGPTASISLYTAAPSAGGTLIKQGCNTPTGTYSYVYLTPEEAQKVTYAQWVMNQSCGLPANFSTQGGSFLAQGGGDGTGNSSPFTCTPSSVSTNPNGKPFSNLYGTPTNLTPAHNCGN